MATPTEKIDAVIKRHFNRFFKEQYIEPTDNEWSALRRAMKKVVAEEIKEAFNEGLDYNADVLTASYNNLPSTGEEYYNSLKNR